MCGCSNNTPPPTICGCTNPCPVEPCACPVLLDSDCVNNVTEDLACSGILAGQTLTEVLVQLDAFICEKFDTVALFSQLVNIGGGSEIYKGVNNLGQKELRTLLGSNLIDLVQSASNVTISVDEEALETFINTLVLPPPVIDSSFLRTIDSTPITTTLKVISDNLDNASVLRLSKKDVTNYGGGDIDTNTAFGKGALLNNGTGGSNTAFGKGALSTTTSGSENTSIGKDAMFGNVTGSGNTVVGADTNNNNYNNSTILGKGATSTGNNQFVVGSVSTNAGAVTTEVETPTHTWTVKINGVDYKILLSEIVVAPVADLGSFGYNLVSSPTACTNSCNNIGLVAVYRDAVDGSFEIATKLCTDVAMTINATAGYYAEYSTAYGEAISRYWNGTAFVGMPAVCGCGIQAVDDYFPMGISLPPIGQTNTYSLNVLSNDNLGSTPTDIISVTSISPPVAGLSVSIQQGIFPTLDSIRLTVADSYVYSPGTTYSFTYTIEDSVNATSTATVTFEDVT